MADHSPKPATQYMTDYDTGKPVAIHPAAPALAPYEPTPPAAAPSLLQRLARWFTKDEPAAPVTPQVHGKTFCMADYDTGKPVCFESKTPSKLAEYEALQEVKHEPSLLETLRQLPKTLLHTDAPAAAPTTPAKPAAKQLDTYRP